MMAVRSACVVMLASRRGVFVDGVQSDAAARIGSTEIPMTAKLESELTAIHDNPRYVDYVEKVNGKHRPR